MLVLPHVATGTALGVLLGDPFIVIPVAVASHFVLDSVPHWQETLAPYRPTWKTYVRIPIDITLSVAVVVFALSLQPEQAAGILAGAIFASIADLDVLVIAFPRLKRGLLARYWDWHCKIQRETSSFSGVASQLAVVVACVAVIVAM